MLVSANIGIAPHLIFSHQWPAYTTHTSPTVKMLVEQDKLRIAKFLATSPTVREEPCSRGTKQAHISQWEDSSGPQEADVTEPSAAESQDSTAGCAPFDVNKDSLISYGGLRVQSSSSISEPTTTCNLVIFSRRRDPLRVLPMKMPDPQELLCLPH
uniref:Uncharacterized protein n=1 Tax=Salvator merianae TaxID=96440 RepID=A0A8D0KNM9_SALMN